MTLTLISSPIEIPLDKYQFSYFATEESLELKSIVDKTLDVWIKIYSDIPSGLTHGEYVSSHIKDNLDSSKLAVLRDSDKVIQAIGQTQEKEGVLRLKNLVVSPWSCRQVRTLLRLDLLKTEEFYGLNDLCNIYHTSVENVLRLKKRSGSLLMLGLCIYAKAHAILKIELLSLSLCSPFYEKIGGKKTTESTNYFIFDLSESLPESLCFKALEVLPEKPSILL
jgi:hypothetical protein